MICALTGGRLIIPGSRVPEGVSNDPRGTQGGRRGYAKALLSRCEAWAREQRCAEFASDCELGNDESLGFRLAAGFEEANRIICFKKKL